MKNPPVGICSRFRFENFCDQLSPDENTLNLFKFLNPVTTSW